MSEFAAERYLRRLGARGPTVEDRHPTGLPLVSAARALVDVGAIELDRAQRVVDDGLAAAKRSLPRARPPAGRGEAVTGPDRVRGRLRVVPCRHAFRDARGRRWRVRSVALAERWMTVAVTVREPRERGGVHSLDPLHVTVQDDRGTTVQGYLHGGADGRRRHLCLHSERALAVDTAWMELDGERIELRDEPLDVQVTVEDLPVKDPALGHLWRRLAARRQIDEGFGIEDAVDALAAAGALDRDDPELGVVRAVEQALHLRPGDRARGAVRLGEPWRSLFATRRPRVARTGTFAVAAVPPPIDGVGLALETLDAYRSGWHVTFVVSPSTNHAGFRPSLQRPDLAWWARDDRGHCYLGQVTSWSGEETYGNGRVSFTPGIPAGASRLEILPTARTERARINIPLRDSGRGR